ncbi:MAG: V-type ATP synthase subunit A [Thermoplasmata archaeon]|nr:V-type ATP synthase subunit A [Thermoplasmata archaeon]
MGTVARVSGPVVVAEGLTGAKMFDVVRVGDLGLVGEIIRLVGDTATVQVYEDTTGIRPGDKVETTGQALSVELGPGLLKSIYDGVQRPLDVLQQNLGDFITRGFVAPALDETKKWEFTPTAKVGSEVTPGTILGTVQETPLILHKIMVPPGVSGTLDDLKAGTFTIRESIGSIRAASGKQPLFLSQKWVVRIPRPVQQKLAPGIPLITGQRVIDTFYPVAKGGTACIPGPFGSGKCVAGDTPVQLDDGTLTTMDRLYEHAQRDGVRTTDGADEWYQLDQPIGLRSLVENRIVRSEARTFYKGKSDTLIRVRTRSGRSVRVTPIHPLFTFGPAGDLRTIRAENLRPGQYLASVRALPGPSRNPALGVRVPKLQRHGHHIQLPERTTPEFGEWLGLFVSEGYVRGKGTVVFTNQEPAMLARFLDLTRTLFGLEGHIERQATKTPNVLVHSVQLVATLDQLGTGRAPAEKRIPPVVLASSNAVLGGFLLGYYLGDGGFSKGDVELCTASRGLHLDLVYALSRFGVTSTMASRRIDGTTYYRVYVRGRPNLVRLAATLDTRWPKVAKLSDYALASRSTYSAVDVVPIIPEVIRRIYGSHFRYSTLLNAGIEIHNYIGNRERMGASTLQTFMAAPQVGGGPSLEALEPVAVRLAELLETLYCDEIVDVTAETNGPYDVFDVAVPEYGANFVGGHGAILLHNTVAQQQLAKWADSDVVVYVGCGERGNEMTEVLATFPNLQDPKTKRPLMERTILIANTSNMPVAAREASVYTGITIAEYYRDMGYDVALMADSTSRWAEAMREISGRLEEMPGEEGYPAYLGRRVAEFYERAGRVITISPEGRSGSVTVVGAVSPPGGDFSEPVSQNTLRVARVFWALDANLASRRHFPSINWLQSYSLYVGDLEPWYKAELAGDFVQLRQKALETLQKESELQEIVQLVGVDALPEREKGILDVARMLREDYLQQSAYDDVDTYTSIGKQYRMLRAILNFGDREQDAIGKGALVADIQKLPVRQKLSRMKWIPEAELKAQFDAMETEMISSVAATAGGA